MIDNYYSDDWRSAKNENDWLNAEGIPMYVRRLDVSNLENEDLNVMISKRDGEYYLQYRTLAEAVADWHYIVSVNEKEAVKIELLPTNKILLVTYDYYSGSPNDEELDSITVEEYYNSSPSIIKDGLTIDMSNMSVGGYPGLDIRNGFVCFQLDVLLLSILFLIFFYRLVLACILKSKIETYFYLLNIL